jgi:HPt (histidine-containing phosphotransfer) domain-containing protein
LWKSCGAEILALQNRGFVNSKDDFAVDAAERQANWVLPEALQYLAEEEDHEAIAAIVSTFRADTAVRLDLLRRAVDRADVAEIRTQAHAITGSARLVGADAVAGVCRQVEAAAVAPEELTRLVELIGVRFEEACRSMASGLGEPQGR